MNLRIILWTYQPRQDGTCNLKIYIHHRGKKKYVATDLHVDPKFWDSKKGLVKASHPMANLYNSRLRSLKNEAEAHFIEGGSLETFGQSSGSIIEFAKEVMSEADRGLLPLRPGTLKNYRATIRRLNEYCQIENIPTLSFNDIDLEFYKKFTGFLESYAGCKLQGISKHIKIIKRLMNMGIERNMHSNKTHQDRSFKVYKSRASTKIYLSQQEIQLIEGLDLKDNEPLERERDRFLVGYYFILRYSDSIRLKRDQLFEKDGQKYLRLIHQKTNKETILPVKPGALAILEKYNWRLDFSSNQQANRALKMIAAMAGINDRVAQDGKTGPKSQFIATHTARRSAATNLYLQGVSLKMIADLGGWDNVETLMIYLRASGLESASLASKLDFFN